MHVHVCHSISFAAEAEIGFILEMEKNFNSKEDEFTTIYFESLDQSKWVSADVNPDYIITFDCSPVFCTDNISILDAVLCTPKATNVEFGEILIS